MKRKLLVVLGAAILAFASFSLASAHAKLDHCTPAVGSTVTAAPAQVVCVYSEEIDTNQSTMSVWNANGIQVDKKDAHVDLNDPDHKTLIVSLDAANTPNGLYTVKWHAVTPDDNGISDGTWQFVVGSASATPYPPTEVVAGETPGAGTPEATTPEASATSTNAAAASNTTATAAPSPTAGATSVESTPTASANSTPAAPTTAPTTGGSDNLTWFAVAIVGILLILGGALVHARR